TWTPRFSRSGCRRNRGVQVARIDGFAVVVIRIAQPLRAAQLPRIELRYIERTAHAAEVDPLEHGTRPAVGREHQLGDAAEPPSAHTVLVDYLELRAGN